VKKKRRGGSEKEGGEKEKGRERVCTLGVFLLIVCQPMSRGTGRIGSHSFTTICVRWSGERMKGGKFDEEQDICIM
jgi:hypothetical protein